MKSVLNEVRVLVVDGRSTDATVKIARNIGAVVVRQDGVGKGDALAKALEYICPEVEYVVLTDADFTYPAKYVPAMIKLLEKNAIVGMVCGNRLCQYENKKVFNAEIYVGNRLLALLHRILNGVQLNDPLTGLRIIRAEVLRGWRVKSKGFDIEIELNKLVLRRGYVIQETPIYYRPRMGRKKLKIRHSLTIVKRMFLEIISMRYF